jgi:hypothetical protein
MRMNDPITKSVSNAYTKMKAEELTDKQKKHIDKNNNNKIDSHDFKLLRKEDNEVEEGWDDMMKAVKAKSGPQPSGGSGVKKGTRYGGSNQKDEPEVKEKPMTKTKKKPFSEMLETYKSAGLKSLFEAIEEKVFAEESTNDEFKAELEDAKAKSEGKKKAEVAKAKVGAVQQEEVEELDEVSLKTATSAYVKRSDKEDAEGEGKFPSKSSETMDRIHRKHGAKGVMRAATALDKEHGNFDSTGTMGQTKKQFVGNYLAGRKQSDPVMKVRKEEEELDIDAINGVRMHTFKERFGDRDNNN